MSETTHTFALKLTEQEADDLMKITGGGPVQKMQEMLKEQMANGKHALELNDMALGRVVRMMSKGSATAQMVELTLTKIGNGLGVILPEEVLIRLQAAEGAPLKLTDGPDGTYMLAPATPDFDEKMQKADAIIARYANTLHALAQ